MATPHTSIGSSSCRKSARRATRTSSSDKGAVRNAVAASRVSTTSSDTTASPDERGGEEAKHSLGFILNLSSSTDTGSHLRTEANEYAFETSMSINALPTACVTSVRICTLDVIADGKDTAAGSRTRPSTRSQGIMKQQTTIPRASADGPKTLKSAQKKKSKAVKPGKTTTKKAMTYEEKRLARKCTVDGCMNYTINRGVCFRHGGGKKCTVDNCNASAKIAGLCWKHGGSVQCVVDGCDRRGKSRGLCWAHGGGTKCQAESCSKVAVSSGYCWAHGGGKRCIFEGCQRPAYERTFNYCPKHYARYEAGEEVMEV